MEIKLTEDQTKGCAIAKEEGALAMFKKLTDMQDVLK